MSKFDFIKDIDEQHKKEIIKQNMKLRKFTFNELVYKIGDRVKYIYFIKQGQVEVRCDFLSKRSRNRIRSRLRRIRSWSLGLGIR